MCIRDRTQTAQHTETKTLPHKLNKTDLYWTEDDTCSVDDAEDDDDSKNDE